MWKGLKNWSWLKTIFKNLMAVANFTIYSHPF